MSKEQNIVFTPKDFTFGKYSLAIKKLIGVVPLSKEQQEHSFDHNWYKREKTTCVHNLKTKHATPYDYMYTYQVAMANQYYEKAQAITEVLKEYGYSTLDTHRYLEKNQIHEY